MDLHKAKAAIDHDAAKAWRKHSSIELSGLVNFLRQEIVDAEWQITKAQHSIKAYQAVIDDIEKSQRDPARDVT